MTLFAYIPVGPDSTLLEEHLAHTRSFGVDRILLDVHPDTGCRATALRSLRRRIRPYDGEVVNVHDGPYDGLSLRRSRALARYCGEDDWVLVSDLDEFPRFTTPPAVLAATCDRQGYDFVKGELVDRVAVDGRLPEVAPGPLSGQFPLAADITGAVMAASKSKVLLMRPRVSLVEGQHHARNGRACPEKLAHVPVDHFKWNDGVLQRSLAMKTRPIGHGPAGEAWRVAEHRRLARFIGSAGGRIDIADPRLDTHIASGIAMEGNGHELAGFPRHPRWNPGWLRKRPVAAGYALAPLLPASLAWLRDRLDGNLNIQQFAVLQDEREACGYSRALELIGELLRQAEESGVVDYPR
jgi:hypothetical protein